MLSDFTYDALLSHKLSYHLVICSETPVSELQRNSSVTIPTLVFMVNLLNKLPLFFVLVLLWVRE